MLKEELIEVQLARGQVTGGHRDCGRTQVPFTEHHIVEGPKHSLVLNEVQKYILL